MLRNDVDHLATLRAEYRDQNKAGVVADHRSDPLLATCGSRQPVAADVVVEAGPNALLFFRRGYADPAPQARPAPRFAATRGVSVRNGERRAIRQQQGSCGQRRQSCNAGFPCTAPSRRFARSTRGCKRLSTCWSGAGPAPRDLRRRQPLLDVRFGARLSGCREDAHCEQTTERVGERGGRLTRVLVEAGDGGR
jgi:hypothetical protein